MRSLITSFQVGMTTRGVIPLVGMHPVWPTQGSAGQAAYGWHGIDQCLKDHRVMAIGTGDAEHQWDTLPVRDEVAFAAELATVRRVGTCVRAPPGAGNRGPIQVCAAQIQLADAAQLGQQQQMQAVPYTGRLPITQPAPAGHATAKAEFLGEVFPGNACA